VTAKAQAYGGVVIDATGKVLLRMPNNHFGGYVWTFAKGRPKPGQTPEQAALCEVEEETGWVCEIVSKIPGSFSGTTTMTEYFLMKPVRDIGTFDCETQRIVWASPDVAQEMIAQTRNVTGRARDLVVLNAAISTHARNRKGGQHDPR
jgi:8-oxo-dGTP pyrophosphatase MutT (NUDIX family)